MKASLEVCPRTRLNLMMKKAFLISGVKYLIRTMGGLLQFWQMSKTLVVVHQKVQSCVLRVMEIIMGSNSEPIAISMDMHSRLNLKLIPIPEKKFIFPLVNLFRSFDTI